MKHLATVAMIVAALAVPVVGQRAVSHGGGAGHVASAPHGSFSGGRVMSPHPGGGFGVRGPSGFRGGPVVRGPVQHGPVIPRGFGPGTGFGRGPGPIRYSPGFHSPVGRMPYRGGPLSPDHRGGRGGYGGGHDRWHDGEGHHHHRAVYWQGGIYPWVYTGPIFTGYVDPWLFAPDDYGYDSGSGYYVGGVAAPYADYGMEPQGYQPWPYSSPDVASTANEAGPSAPVRQSTVTLIFNDGRAPEQIHNFLLTSTTLTVLDEQYRQIPLKDVNVAATEAANRAAGVEFRVPVAQ